MPDTPLNPTIAEIDALIARNEHVRRTWKGVPGYVRNIDIELCALRMLREAIASAAPIGDSKP